MADDKVVIGSNEGVPVKPGDLTTVTSVINTDTAADDSIATASIPRMKMKSGPKSDSAETSTIDKAKIKAKLEEDKPKKKTTVKLKPVVVGETGKETAAPSQPSPSAISTPAPAPSPAQGTSVPRVASEDETAKIKTRPAIASASVAAESSPVPLRVPASPSAISTPAQAPTPAHATAVPKIASEDETVKIQKPRAFVASTAVPGVKQTIKLRPSSTTPAPVSDADASAGPSTQSPQPQPLSVTPAPAPVAPSAPVLAGSSEAKRTIRLVPKKSDATSGGEQSSTTSKPSAPTIKLEETKPAPAESSRSSATINLSSTNEGVEPPAAAGSVLKRTLKLKSTRPPEATTVTPRPIPPSQASASPAPAAPMPVQDAPMPVPPPAVAAATDPEIAASSAAEERQIPSVKEKKPKKEEKIPSAYGIQEPSIIFTIAACIALFVMAYFTWMLVGQYCSNYTDTKISVPGLSGKVK